MSPPAAGRPLIVRIRNWVGDVVLGLPALEMLQAEGYALHIVARGKWAPALLGGYVWPVHLQPQGLRDKVAQLRQLRAQCAAQDRGFLRRENALVLPASFSSALEMRLAGLKAVGVATEGRSLLLARAVPRASTGHELERYWDLACRLVGKQALAPRQIGFRLQAERLPEARRLLAEHGVTGDFVMVCPFAGGRAAVPGKPDKKWPGFEDFVRRAEQRLGLPLVVYPGPGEHAAARELYPAAKMIEGSNLGIYAALLQCARLVVSNDTGPAHVAAALGRPLISLPGPTDAGRWAPWGPGVTVLQHPPKGTQVQWPDADEVLALAAQRLTDRTAG